MNPSVRYYKVIGIVQLESAGFVRIYRTAIISSRNPITREYLSGSPMEGRSIVIERFILNYWGPSWNVPSSSPYNTRAQASAVKAKADQTRVEINQWFDNKCKSVTWYSNVEPTAIEIQINLQGIKVW